MSGYAFFWDTLEKNPFFCLFQILGATAVSWFVVMTQEPLPLSSPCSLFFCIFQIFLSLTHIEMHVIIYSTHFDNPG